MVPNIDLHLVDKFNNNITSMSSVDYKIDGPVAEEVVVSSADISLSSKVDWISKV